MNEQKAPDSQKAAVEPLTIDDVVQAFRWIMGRDPASPQGIAHHRAIRSGRPGLRKALLLSKEFLNRFEEIRAAEFLRRSNGDIPCLPPEERRIVFIHIPKTGGTTLHALLAAAVGEDLVCPARYNDLWQRTGAELAAARLFSGHYDRRCLSFIPGSNTRVVTLLREPRERLRSLYQYLRAHTKESAETKRIDLAVAAREHQFNDFLRAALEINPASVDNTYVRAFGGRLPMERWDRRAELAAPRRLSDLDESVDALVRRACDFVGSLSAVGILEDFDNSLAVLFDTINFPAPSAYEIQQRTADLAEAGGNFEHVPTTIDDGESELLTRLTMFDQVVYDLGRSMLAAKLARRAKSDGLQGASLHGD